MNFGKIKNIYNNLRLKTKMFLVAIFVNVIPMILVSLIILLISQDYIKKNTLNYFKSYSEIINNNIENYIHNLDRVANTIYNQEQVLDILASNSDSGYERIIESQYIEKQLFSIQSQIPGIQSAIIIGENNDAYEITNFSYSTNINSLREQSWYEKIDNSSGELILTESHTNLFRNTKQTTISIGKILYDLNGYRIGLLIIDIEPVSLVSFNAQTWQSIKDYDINIEISTKSNEPIFNLNDKNTGSGNYITLYDTNTSPYVNIIINVLYSELIRNYKLFFIITIIIIIIASIATFIASFSISRNITMPITNLKKYMIEFQKGDFKIIPSLKRKDEIGNLIETYNYMTQKITQLINDVYIAEAKQRQAEFYALQNQINPHFLFNTLESIRMTAINNEDDESAEMIEKFAVLFRSILTFSNEDYTIKDELDYVKTYIDVQNIRFNNIFKLEIDIPEELLYINIPKLSFQPIVENCMNHGFTNKRENCSVKITGELKDSYVILKFTDNGKGISLSRSKKINNSLRAEAPNLDSSKTTHLGLHNIAQRLHIKYGKLFSLEILPHSLGTEVKMVIPNSFTNKLRSEKNV